MLSSSCSSKSFSSIYSCIKIRLEITKLKPDPIMRESRRVIHTCIKASTKLHEKVTMKPDSEVQFNNDTLWNNPWEIPQDHVLCEHLGKRFPRYQ